VRSAPARQWHPIAALAATVCVLAACAGGAGPTTPSAAHRGNVRSLPHPSVPTGTGPLGAESSTLAGQRLFIAWGPISSSVAATWKEEGFTGAFKLIGDFAWDKVEPQPGRFDFGNWDHDEAVLAADHLMALPSLEFLEPPAWFVSQYPGSVVEYGAQGSAPTIDRSSSHCAQCGAGNTPSLSLAWLMDQAQHHTAAWDDFTTYLTASLEAMAGDRSVIGVAFPWLTFKKRQALGSWSAMEHDPGSVLLGDFNPASLASWPGPGTPPTTLAALLQGGAALEQTWERWTQQREGAAFLSIAELLHHMAPQYWISVDKFVWMRMSDQAMHPVLALADGTTGTAFADFLPYLRRFVAETGDNRIVLDDDALMDSSKDANFQLTEQMIQPLGLSFMGESQPGPTGIAGLLASVVATHPDAVVFLPAPGGGGGWVRSSPDAQEILCLVRTGYVDHGCPDGPNAPASAS